MINLKERRKELGLTMRQVADMVGVSEATISRYESGHILHMGEDKIKRYAKALQVPGSSFIDDEDDEKSAPVTADESALLYHLQKTYADDDLEILSSLNRNQAAEIVEQAKKMKSGE